MEQCKRIQGVQSYGVKRKNNETSLTLFDQHGFHGVSVNEIVKACGTSKGGFITISLPKMNSYLSSMITLFHMF